MLKTESKTKYGENQYEGPYVILQVNDNGTIKFRKKNVIETYNIRNIHPHKE